jgi:hypothetical protein
MKNKTLPIILLIAVFFISSHIYAKKVEIKDAKQVAVNFYVEHSMVPVSAKSISIIQDFTISEKSIPLYYVFNFNNNGFVIVSADDIVTPVLGYSYEGIYSDQDQPSQFVYWMNTYKKQIIQAIETGYAGNEKTTAEWNRLNVATENHTPKKGIRSVTPLILTTWDQGDCYNDLCPVDAAGPGGRVWAGCVATCMAQVMNYYRYPEQGVGTHSYNSSGYGTLSVNCGTTTYNWNAMTLVCSGVNNAIATLLYHCGVTVNMGYSPTGSGAQMSFAASSLTSHFKYSTGISNKQKVYYTETQWADLLKVELDNKRPTMYAGYDTSATGGGHAFNCDGYQDSIYFHFNWGWSGTANGYYYLTALTPAGSNFTTDQSVITGVYPGSGYPYGCTTTPKNVTSSIGTIEDGSGPSDYLNNQDCYWLIAPADVIDHIKISFDYFSTESVNDIVTIYDGPATSDAVLGTYSGSALPSTITSTNDSVLVRFTTNSSTTSSGWFLTYTSVYPVYCSGLTTLTALTDTFSDGSGVNNYNSSTNCRWQIKPAGATSVTLHFINFATEATNDKIRVINNTNSATLATLSGATLPADVTCPSGDMIVWFTCNSSTQAQGWTAYYTSSATGIEDNSIIKDLAVYPNPANENLHVSFTNTGNDATVQILNVTGQIVYSELISGNTALFSRDIDISEFAKGIYNLKILAAGETINKKVVVE